MGISEEELSKLLVTQKVLDETKLDAIALFAKILTQHFTMQF